MMTPQESATAFSATATDLFLSRVRQDKFLRLFTTVTRVMLAIGFLPSGWKKVAYQRFTILGIDDPVGFFFEALYRAGFYYRFIGIAQVTAAILLLIPRTALLGALLYFPIILNIFIITVSMHFRGTPFITGAMLLANVYLLCWDYSRIKRIFQP